ncbi:hypothetical protein EDD11_001381 [Mortierella claussenii]|nr:hypothetical protein EDD11_001381 [Mortierella claussenii]
MSWLAKNVGSLGNLASRIAAEANGDNQQASNELLQQLNQQLEQTRDELFERHQEWERAKQNYEARLKSLTEGNATAQKVEQLEQKLNRAVELLKTLNSEKQNLNAKIKVLEEEKTKAEAAVVEATEAALAARAVAEADKVAQEHTTSNGLTTDSHENSASQERIQALEAEKECATSLAQTLQSQMAELIESNKGLKEQLQRQQEDNDSHADIAIQLEITKEELEQTKVEISLLKETNTKLSSQSKATPPSSPRSSSSPTAAKELADAKSTIAKLEARLAKESEHIKEITVLKASQKQLQETVAAVRTELAQSQTKHSQSQSELLSSKEAKDTLERKEAFMTESIAQLDAQLSALKMAEEKGMKALEEQFEQEKRALLATQEQLQQKLEDLKDRYDQECVARSETSVDEASQGKLVEQLEEEKEALLASQDLLKQELEALKTQHEEDRLGIETLLKGREATIQELQKNAAVNEQQLRAVQDDLQKAINERNHFQSQHKTLLDRVSNMKSTLGTKLQADMENINTLRQQIDQLTAQNNGYIQTIKQLEEELMASHEHYEKTSRELEHLRRHMVDIKEDAFAEVMEKENLIHELQSRLQREEREREDWETMASEQRASKDQAIMTMRALERERDAARAEKEVLRQELDREIESLTNLQGVLEEFQSAKESEIQFALERLQGQLHASNTALEEYKGRAHVAEEQLHHLTLDVEKARQLEREVKEKNLTIGKLRHDAVIQQGHLTEAMRRLKEESSQNTVDIPLISNLFISFLNIPRGDQKRFEILQLISGVLKFTDEQREQAGLIRKAGSGLGAMTPTTSGSRSPSMEQMRQHQEPKESFFDMWASFLIRESNSNAASNNSSNSSHANSRSP